MRLFACTLVLCLVSCSNLGPHVCTLIGCDSGTTVHLASKPADAYKIEVFAGPAIQQPAYVFDCPDPTKCVQDEFFPGLISDRLIVRVTVGSAVRTTQLNSVAYVSSQPNGPDCGPPCLQATVTADIP
jgi:hypothetical protein